MARMMKTCRWLLLALLPIPLLSTHVAAETAAWSEIRYLSGGGYWPWRVPVTIENPTGAAVAGDPVAVSAAALAGQRIEALRVCTATGEELLFDVTDKAGHSRRTGLLAMDDQVVVPVECPARGATTVYLYAGNELAWPVAEFLKGGFQNGDFSAGSSRPEGWLAGDTDTQHRVTWEAAGGRNHGRCVKVEVDAGAEPTWVQWRQPGIPVTPGRTYQVSGWVRAEEVAGQAGWYVHVDGEKPQLISKIFAAGTGTFDWKQVTATFTAPPTAMAATLGTVLHGTGRAWYADAQIERVADGSALRVKTGAIERLDLAKTEAGPPPFSREWPCCASVRVFNFTALPVAGALVHADLRPALAKASSVPRQARLRIVDAATGQAVGNYVRLSDGVLFAAAVPAKAQRDFLVYFNATQLEATNAFLSAYEQLMSSPLNLAPNPSFEAGAGRPADWLFSGQTSGFGTNAVFGRRSAEFTVPPEAKKNWVGWRSRPISVQPNASYFYGGFLKGNGLTGSMALHAHQLDRSRKMTVTGGAVSAPAMASANTDWMFAATVLQTPPDGAALELHLTMNDTGTLQHDGIVLCRVLPGAVVGMARTDAAPLPAGLSVWEENPLVKVFPDSLPREPARRVAVECARNEYEPFELVLRNAAPCRGVQVAVTPLLGPGGATLPPVKVERVGFVPIDWPSSYFQTSVPAWQRRVPGGAGQTDGWSDWWPDPLLPNSRFDLAANRAQPLWFTIRVPRAAAPGDYCGQVEIRTPDKAVTLPLRVRVLPFALPEQTRLKVIFDFPTGPGGDYGTGMHTAADRRMWYRFMAEHRLGADHIMPPPKFDYTAGQVTMDATAFDEVAHYCFDELHMPVAFTPEFFYAFGWAYVPKKVFGLEPFTPEYNTAVKQAYRLFSEHVRQKGWHDKFIYYLSDEPHFHQPHVVAQMKALCALVHAVDATMPIYSSTWQYCPAWDEALDMWGIGQYGSFPLADMERLRKRGTRYLFTVDGQMATDTPYLATERMLPYYCYKYGIDGYEFWGLAWWTFDPWQFGWHAFINQSDDGKQHYWIRYPNGDGFLAYPGAPIGVAEPVSTIRLEEVRKGLEDYEALAMLTDLVAQARQQGRPVAAAEQALTLARALVTIPNAGGLRSTEILPQPDRIPAVRKAVNSAIVNLMGE